MATKSHVDGTTGKTNFFQQSKGRIDPNFISIKPFPPQELVLVYAPRKRCWTPEPVLVNSHNGPSAPFWPSQFVLP